MGREESLQRRLAWFHAGVEAINRIVPGTGPYYVCPLCLEMYDEDSVRDGRLSDEHAPPGRLGGRAVTLTCKQCNSRDGHEIDYHALKDEQMFEFVTGTTTLPVKATISAGDAPIRGTVVAQGDTVSFFGVPKANHPDAHAVQEAVLHDWRTFDPQADRRFTITFGERWSQRRARNSWVRSAFLIAFACWGYSYALQPEFDLLREQLARPDEDLLPSTVLLNPRAPVTTRAVHLITEPPWRGVIIGMGRRSVFLPWTPDPNFFQRTAQAFEEMAPKVVMKLSGGSLVPWPSRPEFNSDRQRR